MKTGITSSAYFGVSDYEQGLKKMKAHGYDCLDYQEVANTQSPLFSFTDGEFEKYLTEVVQCVAENGLQVFQMHGLWPTVDDTTKEGRAKNAEYFIKEIHAAKLLRCKHLVIHPCMPYGWGEEKRKEEAFERTVETVEKILPFAKKSGVIVCVENMPFGKGHSFSKIQDLKELITVVNDENLKACFDTGHSKCTEENVEECIVTLGQDLKVLHVHDTRRWQDLHMLPFTGEIDWAGFIKGLQTIGYEGCISLETKIPPKMPEAIRERMQAELANLARWFAREVENKGERQ